MPDRPVRIDLVSVYAEQCRQHKEWGAREQTRLLARWKMGETPDDEEITKRVAELKLDQKILERKL